MKRPAVFVVDDEAQICTLLTRILAREGYDVRAFTSGQEALDAAVQAPPEVVVTDLMMPGMTGLEMVRKMRESAPDLRAVLTTGYASVDTVVDALRSGIDDFVTKPFGVADIRAVVSRVLAGGRADVRSATAQEEAKSARPREEEAAAPTTEARVVESVHGLFSDGLTTAELLPRCGPLVLAAVDAGRGALLAPTGVGAEFRVRSVTRPTSAWTSRIDVVSQPLARLASSGAAARVERSVLGDAATLLEDGPLAAAPLRPRDLGGDDCGLLVVSRPADGPPFGPEHLRVLGVVASALGDVFHAVRAAERAEEAYFGSLCDVAAAGETRTPWFANHGERVRGLSVALAKRLGLGAADVEILEMASRLLDLGRVETPDELLGKAGRPTDEEWRELRRHAARSDEMVRPLGRLRNVKPVLRHHHENWDGTGYPDGLHGDEIPYLASLVRVTDSFAALTSERAWRPAFDAPTAVRRIAEMSGRHFHPQIAAAFAQMQYEAETAS